VEKLRDCKALHGRKPTELYQLEDSTSQPLNNSTPQPSRADLVRSTLVDLRQQCESVVELRDRLNKRAYATACARLHRTLEELTGSGWNMNGKPGENHFFKEHGDIYELGN
jgi:hypothetical protein